MRVDLFDFDLPEERIALRPVEPRDAARLLVVDPSKEDPLSDSVVSHLPDLLRAGDCLVFNDTRVIPARLYGIRRREGASGARIEVTLHMRLGQSDWRAFARPAKRLRAGDVVEFSASADTCMMDNLKAVVRSRGEAGQVDLAFDFSGPVLDEAIQRLGEMPLPPYIAGKRVTDSRDEVDYQTIYAENAGAVAAPTAGLHFTKELMDDLTDKGISLAFVTLHVGAGTFLPVKTADTSNHKMHSEWGEVSDCVAAQLNDTRANGGRVIAVGTTSLRLLESAASDDGQLKPYRGETDIFITPGYRFRAVDALMTNFHLPRSTLFMLVSAFSGLDAMQSAYRHAIDHDYRFYSYGDACLLWPRP